MIDLQSCIDPSKKHESENLGNAENPFEKVNRYNRIDYTIYIKCCTLCFILAKYSKSDCKKLAFMTKKYDLHILSCFCHQNFSPQFLSSDEI